MPAELSGVICGGIVLLPHVYVTCMCVYVNVVACSENYYFFEKQIVLTLLNRRWVHQWRSYSLHVVRVCVCMVSRNV